MITVACVWVRGNVPYTVDYVVKLRAMVARRLAVPHRFVCLTDRPGQLPVDMHRITIETLHRERAWWAKMRLFDPNLETAFCNRRMLYLDLDTLVVGDLDPIAAYESDFALAPPGGSFKPRGFETVQRFNSSVMVWTFSEATRELWRGFSPDTMRRYWGDQDYLGAALPSSGTIGQTMPTEWFPRLSELDGARPGPGARVVLTKKPKNHIAAHQFPWIAEIWRVA